MKTHSWTYRRHFVPPAPPHRRVDQAYQCLLRWTLPLPPSPPTASRSAPNQEVREPSGFICPALQRAPAQAPTPGSRISTLSRSGKQQLRGAWGMLWGVLPGCPGRGWPR